jgi:RHS repeat-associated protein
VSLKRESLHVMDGAQRIALVETRTQGDDGTAVQLIRYQFGNHLGSASLELDDLAQIISYEEYYPYGCTSYQAGRSAVEVALKRYRFTGMERDEETGFNYHGARYYVPWFGRWANCDPVDLQAGVNLYAYCSSNCIVLSDPNGTDPPSDATYTSEYHGSTVITTEQIQRGSDIARLVTTMEPGSEGFRFSQHLYRGQALYSGHAGREWELVWTDVTKEASKEGPLSVEWNMPSLDSGGTSSKSGPRVGEIIAEQAISEVPPSLVIPYVKDSILTEHFEFSPPGVQQYEHWADTIGRRWHAVGGRKTSFWYNKVVSVASAGVEGLSTINTAAQATKILSHSGLIEKPIDAVDLIKNVNPTGGTKNCVNCAAASDASLAGNPASALPGKAVSIKVLEKQFGATFVKMADKKAIDQAMKAAGPGAQGIVFGMRKGAVGHVFNAVNQGGVVRYVDGQIGKAASFSGYSGFKFLRTK